jgi:hypothetical protein
VIGRLVAFGSDWRESGHFQRTLEMSKLTRSGSRVGQNAVMHKTAFFNDVVGFDPQLEENI